MEKFSDKRRIAEKIVNWFEKNPEVFEECIEELDSAEGYLNDSRYFDMDEFELFVRDREPIDILNRAFFGFDETCGSSGFNPNRDYFRVNGYGNFVSADRKDYSVFNDKEAVERMAMNIDDIYGIESNGELKALFDAYEECDE